MLCVFHRATPTQWSAFKRSADETAAKLKKPRRKAEANIPHQYEPRVRKGQVLPYHSSLNESVK
jgi:hypothetical protein